jgi:hypothetical protein
MLIQCNVPGYSKIEKKQHFHKRNVTHFCTSTSAVRTTFSVWKTKKTWRKTNITFTLTRRKHMLISKPFDVWMTDDKYKRKANQSSAKQLRVQLRRKFTGCNQPLSKHYLAPVYSSRPVERHSASFKQEC